MKKKTIKFVIVNIIAWILFILTDLISERANVRISNISYIPITVIILVLYTVEEIKTGGLKTSFPEKALEKLVWLITNAIIAIPICCLVNSNKWLIEQNYSHMFLDLNGLEYFVTAGFYTVIPIIYGIILDVILFTRQKKRVGETK